MSRRGRRGERGAETLELIGCAGLLALVVVGARDAVDVARLTAAAQEDARILARWEATCDGAAALRLADVDPALAQLGAAATSAAGGGGVVAVTVSVPAPAELARLGVRIHAEAAMRREPECAR